ncbi:MAG: hypothetical protein JSR78_07550 [Proteobacteria bacterium]|nr:hypothetical protein [Pseudomonadota bacterium]
MKYYLEAGYSPEFITACALAAVPPRFRGDRNAVFVDIGAGYGLSSFFVERILKSTAMAVEPGSWAELGARELGLNVHRALFENLPADVLGSLSGKQVLLHLNSVVEHLVDPLAAIQSIMKTSKIDVLAAVVPDGASINMQDPFIGHVGTLAPGDHLHLPTIEGMRIFLGRLGFKHTAVKRAGALLIAVGAYEPVVLPDDSEIKAYTRQLLDKLVELPNTNVSAGARIRALGIAVADGDVQRQQQLIEGMPMLSDYLHSQLSTFDELPYYLPMAAFFVGSYWLQSGDIHRAYNWFSIADTSSLHFQNLHPGYSAAATDFGWAARLFLAHAAACLGNREEARLCLEKVIDSQHDLVRGAKSHFVKSAEEQLRQSF